MRPAPAAELIAWGYWVLPGRAQAPLDPRGRPVVPAALEAFGAVPAYASGIVKAGNATPHAPDGPPGSGPTVTFSRSNLAVPWDGQYPSLLDFAEACDVPVGFGCRHGACPTAKAASSPAR